MDAMGTTSGHSTGEPGRGGKIGRNGCSSTGRTLFVRPYTSKNSLPAVNPPTYSNMPWHYVPVGSSMLGHWVPGAERMRALPVHLLRHGHALMLSWHSAAGSAGGSTFPGVCPYYGPSKIGSYEDATPLASGSSTLDPEGRRKRSWQSVVPTGRR